MELKIALAGNPNCGKTTLFNVLTGSNQYVGNWPGVTVEKKEGRLKGNKDVIIQDLPGIYSLSAYHVPAAVNVFRATWERGWSFIKRAGTIILASSIILWFLQGFGFVDGQFTMVEDNNSSLLAAVGSAICVIFAPLGFGDWQSTVAVFTGLIAKENVVSTFGVLFGVGAEAAEDDPSLWAAVAAHYTPLVAVAAIIYLLVRRNRYDEDRPVAVSAVRASGN